MVTSLTKVDLYDYFLVLAGLLGLGQWEFEHDPEEPTPPEGGSFLADADIRINDHAEIATLRLGEHLLTRKADAAYIRRVLVHEALHCHRARTSSMVRLDVEPLLGRAADHMFWASYSRTRELEIDAVARVIAPLLPLPPWAEQDVKKRPDAA